MKSIIINYSQGCSCLEGRSSGPEQDDVNRGKEAMTERWEEREKLATLAMVGGRLNRRKSQNFRETEVDRNEDLIFLQEDDYLLIY